MKRWSRTMAAAALTLCGFAGLAAARADEPEPPQSLMPPPEAPPAPAPIAPPATAKAPDTTATTAPKESPGPAAPAPGKAKKKRPGSVVPVPVTNARGSSLVALEAAPAGSDLMKKVAGPIEPGKTVTVRIPHGEDCRVDLRGAFADGQTMDASDVDVCAAKALKLTD